MLRLTLCFIHSVETSSLELRFHFWKNKKKSQGAKSGEYEGCGMIVILFSAKYFRVARAVCAGASSGFSTVSVSFVE